MKFKNVLIVSSFIIVAGCDSPNSSRDTRMNLNDSSSGIVGGTEVQEGSREMVSTVLLFDKARNSLCTGTLIDDQLVLTAGHCVDENSKEMVVIFAKKIEEVNLESVRPVVEIKRHEQYDPKIPKNLADVAMVKFEALPGLPDGYAPAKILSDWSLLQAQTKFIAAGYGINKAWIFKKGSGTLRTIELEISDPNFSETEVLIDQSLNRGVCSGDSGGPGYIDINGQLYLWGIVSRGDAIRFPLFPNCFLFSVYTRVDSYLSWISSARRELLNKGMN